MMRGVAAIAGPSLGKSRFLGERISGIAKGGSLRSHARRAHLLAGSAVRVDDLQENTDYAGLVKEQCDTVVAHNEMKWVALRPKLETFDFHWGETLVQFAHKNRMRMRGHTLAWHESVPNWIREDANQKNARQIFVDHITTVCRHFSGHVHSWDVVNEAILPKDGEPGAMRKSFWYENVGPGYIDLAFRTAHAADPKAKLTYNDYGVEYDNAEDAERRARVLELVRGMKQRGVPIHAVGIQSHIKAAQDAGFGKGLTDYLASIHAMGLEVYLTELDVNEDDIVSDDVALRDAEIAKVYTDFLRVALASPAVKAVLTWDITDRFTWLNNGPTHARKQPSRPQRSLPFDRDFHPKAAFFAMRDSFDTRRTS
jgi:endo-1,4-beta-xylanase